MGTSVSAGDRRTTASQPWRRRQLEADQQHGRRATGARGSRPENALRAVARRHCQAHGRRWPHVGHARVAGL